MKSMDRCSFFAKITIFLGLEVLADGKEEARAFSRICVGPYLPLMEFHDLFTMRKADAGAFVLSPAVQALEDDKDPFQELFFDADAVVADGELPFTAVLGGGDRDLGWAFGVTEFNGVDD